MRGSARQTPERGTGRVAGDTGDVNSPHYPSVITQIAALGCQLGVFANPLRSGWEPPCHTSPEQRASKEQGPGRYLPASCAEPAASRGRHSPRVHGGQGLTAARPWSLHVLTDGKRKTDGGSRTAQRGRPDSEAFQTSLPGRVTWSPRRCDFASVRPYQKGNPAPSLKTARAAGAPGLAAPSCLSGASQPDTPSPGTGRQPLARASGALRCGLCPP